MVYFCFRTIEFLGLAGPLNFNFLFLEPIILQGIAKEEQSFLYKIAHLGLPFLCNITHLPFSSALPQGYRTSSDPRLSIFFAIDVIFITYLPTIVYINIYKPSFTFFIRNYHGKKRQGVLPPFEPS